VFRSISLGKLAGIDIRIHSTLVFGALWIVYEYGISGHGGVVGAVYGLLLLLLVMGCVVLHELGHSFMAREYGSTIRDITIYPLGGAAYIERMPSDPRAEAAVTIAGPLVNVAIAASIFPVVVAAGLISGQSSVADFLNETAEPSLVGLLVSIFLFNLVNVVFNLIPAFPMDGGRLVRAGLTTVLGRVRATNVAVIFGYSIATVMIVVGIWLFQPTLPFIGLFVMYLAYSEGKGVRIEAMMRRMHVGQFVLWDGGGVAPDEVLKMALVGGTRDVVVTSDLHVVGMLWRNDILRALRQGAADRPVADIMDRNPFSAQISTSVHDVHELMEETNRWAVPVVEGEHYRGIFTADRLMHVYKLVNDQTSLRRRLVWIWNQASTRMRQAFGSA
jgi:Zn-dependent protease/CBS domain-containing protein